MRVIPKTQLLQMKNIQTRLSIYYTSAQYCVTRLMTPSAPSPAPIEVNTFIANTNRNSSYFDKTQPPQMHLLLFHAPKEGLSALAGCHTSLSKHELNAHCKEEDARVQNHRQ